MTRVTTDARKNALLDALARLGNLKRACDETGISATTHYQWLRSDPAYASAYEDAATEAAEMLEAEAFRRAHDGVDKPVFYQGEQCGVIREYSDSLLSLLLKARRPDVFGDKIKQEITGKDGAPLHNAPDLSKLDEQELTALEALLRKATNDSNAGSPGSGAVTPETEQD